MPRWISKPLNVLGRWTSAPQRRFLRSRPGSVLILVVALLVILALLGTAYISTTRIERYTTNQNAANTQIDLLMDGLVNMIQGSVDGDLFNQSDTAYRTPQTWTGGNDSYTNIDSPAVKNWLAARIPDLRDNTAVYNATAANLGGTNPGGWESISWPLLATNQQYQFDQPNGTSVALSKQVGAWNSTTNYAVNDVVTATGATGTHYYVASQASLNQNPASTTGAAYWTVQTVPPKAEYRYEPTSTTVNGVTMPAFERFNVQTGAPEGKLYIAADTDHDGVADAMLWKLPIGPLDGVTYYAAYRVVDNNAAINVNTAMSVTSDFDAAGADLKSGAATLVNPSLFTSNVGLLELLDPTAAPTEFKLLNVYRLNLAAGYDSSLTSPHTDAGTIAPNYAFLSQGDELYHELGSRIGNPGYNGSSTTAIPAQLQAVPLTDGISLASSFCIHNTSISSMLESQLLSTSVDNLNSATYKAPTQAYDPTQTGLWFAGNFNFTLSPPTQFPLRALLTTNNGASNRTGEKIISSTAVLPAGALAGTKLYDVINPGMTPYDPPVADPSVTYQPGNWIKYKSLPNGPWGVYRCLKATTISNAPDAATRDTPTAYWSRESWTPTPVKTSINTATFPELWRSFYNVMSDQWDTAPNSTAGRVGTAMFKSSIREPATNTATPSLTDIQMVQLRAALAAVNAMDLRDTDNDITSRNLVLYDDLNPSASPAAKAPVNATVFGTEKQPFITKVIVVQTSATTWWVGIELYNPYVELQYPGGEVAQANPVIFYMGAAPAGVNNIGLGCRIGLVTRTAAAAPVLNELNGAPMDWTTTTAPSIGPGQYILLASSATLPPGVSVTDATRVAVVPGLDALAGTAAGGGPGEVVLYRTRLATGVASTRNATSSPVENDPTKQYDETNLWENVPFDQFDMTGAPAFTQNDIYYYGRPTQVTTPMPSTSAQATDYWKCVFPLSPTAVYTPTAGGEPIPASATATPATPLLVCQADPLLAKAPWHQIQLNNVDWPSPHVSGGKSAYPMGGFARNGDILQVPFIGAYSLYTATTPIALPATMLEINSVTMDALYAEDSATMGTPASYDDPQVADTGNEVREQVGRFCPLTAVPAGTPLPSFPATGDPYAWASRLFDYFTVQAPHDDYLPNVDPDSYVRNGGTAPVAVANTLGATANVGEDGVPVQGLININTADWKVLSMLPLVRASDGSVDLANTQKLAQAIVRYREKNGPFQTIFDLNKVTDTTAAGAPVPGFQNGYGMMDFTFARTNDVDGRQGDLTPNDPAHPYPSFASTAPYSPTDGVTGDFKEKFLAMTRISNLITTQSDSFTCYAMIQGWRGNQLVAQRRAAFIIDRSNIGYQLDSAGNRQLNTTPSVVKVPTN